MKRFIDIMVSLCLIVVLLPVFAIISILIKIDSRGPVIFKQKRVGLHGSHFTIYKFRTMKIGTPDKASDLLDQRSFVTSFGIFLRKSSLDEIPQLFNIIKGEMSFVGPRPALYNQYELNKMRDQAGIHNLRPGITGLAQINGRDDISDEDKVKWDKEYFDNQSILLDLKIVAQTAMAVLSSKNIKG